MRRHRAQGHGAKSKRIRATKRQAAELMEIAARSIQGGKQLLLNLNNAWTLRGTRHRVYSPVRFTLTFRNRRRTSSLLPSNSSPKPNAMAITNWYVGVAKGGGSREPCPPHYQHIWWFCALRDGITNKIIVARLKSNILPPEFFFGPPQFWADYATELNGLKWCVSRVVTLKISRVSHLNHDNAACPLQKRSGGSPIRYVFPVKLTSSDATTARARKVRSHGENSGAAP